ncbi:hypothetical protein SCHPADRAFT_907668 [Schizopora paradoxa]|uniref:Thioredoxin domain-containing protein n=1 Tax=Schizopora paradoxa TaxID=27342 RepID=A0A0H2RXS3_9AGAM|nr:hypothetical protein SCHPADRAFT_907668 [Schizopora paradoxa]
MMLPQLLALSLALAPNLVSAAIFPDNSLVKMIDAKGFKNAMKQNETSVVAFVAPWCGHCQAMAPEYSKAALGLYPLVPLYAVDCDAAKNKKLCADQGVKGFPTVKMFPRGKQLPPKDFEGPDRTASAFFYFAQRNIPHWSKKIHQFEDIEGNVNAEKIINRPRALLMNKSNKMPLLWMVLDNKYHDQISFFNHRDKKGRSSVKLGFEPGEDGQGKILIYPPGEKKPVMYKGILKHDSLSKFFDSILDGTADLSVANEEAATEEFIPDPEVLEIERQQEAEMLALAHGGFSDMIDFEAALKDTAAKNFHAQNGYPGMMGAAPNVDQKYLKKPAGEGQGESSSSSKSKKIRMPMTGDGGEIVMDVTSTVKGAKNQPQTPVPGAEQTEAAAAEEAPSPEPPVEAEAEPVPDHKKDEL